MSKNERVPGRERKSDKIDYLSIDKDTFKDLVINYGAVLEKQLELKVTHTIRVRGFDDSFKDVDQFLDTIRNDEWKSLSEIDVYYYPEPFDMDYGQLLSLRLGSFILKDSGLEVSYGTRMSDIQHLAIKKDSDTLLQDYQRKVSLNPSQFASLSVGVILAISIFIALLTKGFGITFKEPLDAYQISVLIFLTLIIAWIVFGIIYFISKNLHERYIPHFETLIEENSSKYSNVKKNLVIFGIWIGVISGSLAIIDVFTRIFTGR